MFWKLNRVEEFNPLTTVFHMTAFADDSKARMDVTIRGSDLIAEIAGGSAFGDMFKIVYDTDDDGKVNGADFADVAGSVDWENVQDPPLVFPPEAHTHTLDSITDAGDLAAVDSVGTAEIDANAVTLPKLAQVSVNQILGRGTAGKGDVEVLTLGSTMKITAGNVLNADLSELGGGDMLGSNNLGDVTDPAAAFDNIKQDATDSYAGVVTLAANKGTAAGTVVQATDDRLSDAREPTAHTHEIEDVDELTEALSEKAEVAHTHAIEDVTDLSSTLSGKANATHSHIISDVTGLQTALNNKADASHNHDGSAITSGEVSLARGGTGTSLTAPSADGLFAYDKSASKAAFFGIGTGLKFNDVTLELDGVQLTDPMLSDWLGLEWAENTLPYVDGPDSFALTSITAMGRGILAAEDGATLASAAGLGTAAFLDAGTGSGNVITGADSRLTDARTPTSHTHAIADLPVASSGESSSSKLPRADDSRLSDSRVPSGAIGGGDFSGNFPDLIIPSSISIGKAIRNGRAALVKTGFDVLVPPASGSGSWATNMPGVRYTANLANNSSRFLAASLFADSGDPELPGDLEPNYSTYYGGGFSIVVNGPSLPWNASLAGGLFIGYIGWSTGANTMSGGVFLQFRVDGGVTQITGTVMRDSTVYNSSEGWVNIPSTTFSCGIRFGNPATFFLNQASIGTVSQTPNSMGAYSFLGVAASLNAAGTVAFLAPSFAHAFTP